MNDALLNGATALNSGRSLRLENKPKEALLIFQDALSQLELALKPQKTFKEALLTSAADSANAADADADVGASAGAGAGGDDDDDEGVTSGMIESVLVQLYAELCLTHIIVRNYAAAHGAVHKAAVLVAPTAVVGDDLNWALVVRTVSDSGVAIVFHAKAKLLISLGPASGTESNLISSLFETALALLAPDLENATSKIDAMYIETLLDRSEWALDQNLVDDAAKYQREAGERAAAFGEKHTLALRVKSFRGILHEHQDHYEQAFELFQEVYPIIADIHGAKSFPAAAALFQLAKSAHTKGDNVNALVQFQEVLTVFKSDPLYSYLAARVYLGLALVHDVLNNLPDAVAACESSRKLILPADRFNIGLIAYSLRFEASLNIKLGDLELGLKKLAEVVKLHEDLHGDKHLATAKSRQQLGQVYLELGRPTEALVLFTMAVESYEAALGDHIDTATAYSMLSTVIMRQRPITREILEHAKRQLTKAKHIMQATTSAVHPEKSQYPHVVLQLASVEGALNNTKEAVECCFEALETKKTLVGARDNSIAVMMVSVIEILSQQQQYERALEVCSDAESIFLAQTPVNPEDVSQIKYAVGMIRFKQKNTDEALQYIQEAISIKEAELGPDHLSVSQSLCGLAAVYLELGAGSREKALVALERALKIRERHLGPTHEGVVDLAQGVKQLRMEVLKQKKSATVRRSKSYASNVMLGILLGMGVIVVAAYVKKRL